MTFKPIDHFIQAAYEALDRLESELRQSVLWNSEEITQTLRSQAERK